MTNEKRSKDVRSYSRPASRVTEALRERLLPSAFCLSASLLLTGGSRSLALLGAGRVELLIGNESPLRQPRQTHKRQSDEKVHGGGKEPDSQVIVVHARKLAIGLRQLDHRDHRDQGRILEKGDKIIRHRRDHKPQRLWDDHVPKRLQARHPERQRRLHLRSWDRLNARAIVLGFISAVVKA